MLGRHEALGNRRAWHLVSNAEYRSSEFYSRGTTKALVVFLSPSRKNVETIPQNRPQPFISRSRTVYCLQVPYLLRYINQCNLKPPLNTLIKVQGVTWGNAACPAVKTTY